MLHASHTAPVSMFRNMPAIVDDLGVAVVVAAAYRRSACAGLNSAAFRNRLRATIRAGDCTTV